MNKKITFPELVDNIAELTNSSKRVSELFLKELFGIIKEQLEQGENVKIKNFGTFKVTEISSRKSVNINTGEEMEIPAHRKVTFTPDKSLAEAINMPFEGFETVILDDNITEEELNDISEDIIVTEETAEIEVKEEPQPPIFTHKDEELQENKIEKGDVEEVLEIAEELKKEESVSSKTESIEIVEQSTSESLLPTVIQNSYIDEDEFEEEVKREKRKSFFGGIVACLGIVVALGYVFISRGYIVMNIGSYEKTTMIIENEIPTDTLQSDTFIVETKPKQILENIIITDTIRNNYYLTKMSRKHYGRYEFWVYIYEENKDKISDPNNVSPGLVVIIPSTEKYGIDKNNPESVQRAKDKADIILK